MSSRLAQVNVDLDAPKPTQSNSSTDDGESGAFGNPLTIEHGEYTVQNIYRQIYFYLCNSVMFYGWRVLAVKFGKIRLPVSYFTIYDVGFYNTNTNNIVSVTVEMKPSEKKKKKF